MFHAKEQGTQRELKHEDEMLAAFFGQEGAKGLKHEGTKARRHEERSYFYKTKMLITGIYFQPFERIEPFELIEPLKHHKPL